MSGFSFSRWLRRGRRDGQRASRDAGFTLIEAVTAMGIFAIAALALMQLNTQNVRGQTQTNAVTLARIVAHNQLVTIMADDDPPRAGVSEGREELGGRTWVWRTTTFENPATGVLQIQISVFGEGDLTLALVESTAFRSTE